MASPRPSSAGLIDVATGAGVEKIGIVTEAMRRQ